MDAKEYLRQLQEIEIKLINKLSQIEEYDYLAEKLQIDPELPEYIEACETFTEYIEQQQRILKTLESLSFDHYIVLYKHYYEHKLLQEAHKELNKSYAWIKNKHKSALAELQKVLDERESKA